MKRRAPCLLFPLFLALSLLSLPAWPAPAADPVPLDPNLLDTLALRALGPANMGGRLTALAVVPGRPKVLYVGSGSGGLWKTTNNGTTWTPVFDRQPVLSIGDVAVAPSDPEVVWVGTGEANPRNSVSWGNGVYKSTDGGQSWKHMGLADTAHIGRIVIHPTQADTVYVAAVGRFWGPSHQRGLYKTTDGGESWRCVAYVDDETGFIDLVMDPGDPETLYAAAYCCRRDAFAGGNPRVQFSRRAGLYKTTDGGETWLHLTHGLPDRPLGRCGIDVCRKDPRLLYAVVQSDRTDIRAIPGQGPKTAGSVEVGGIFRSEDRGLNWTKVNDLCPRPFYYGQVRIDPADSRRVYVLGVSLYVSEDGGLTFRANGAPGLHADHHVLWIDPRDPEHLVLGGDGGLSFSYDRGVAWEHLENLPAAQFYRAGVDLRRPYHIYGGLQDNGSWGGPSATYRREGITPADWFRVYGGDGFACQVDPTDADNVYVEGQYGRLQRINVRTGTVAAIRPRPARGRPAYRFNWNSPLLLSPHNPRTLYYGGNHLFRSVDRGEHWQVISPDLTRGKPGPSPDMGHTLTALAESPLKPGLLYAGTDDGRVHVSRDGGATWREHGAKLPGVPADGWITGLECSHFTEGTAYLAVDRHRLEDRRPYLFRTTDYGASWRPLAGDLPPEGPVHVVREDLRNAALLFAGTEFGPFASLDGGTTWHRLHHGIPRVAVHDLVIHPRDRDLIVATHGRGLYVLDVAPLEELTPDVLAADAYLFEVKPAARFDYHATHARQGAKLFAAPNPPFGATLYYYLRRSGARLVQLTITDPLGRPVASLETSTEAGLHRITWGLERTLAQDRGRRSRSLVAPGDYVARLKVGDRTLSRLVRVQAED